MFNINELDDFDNNALEENDYSAVEVPKARKEVKEPRDKEYKEYKEYKEFKEFKEFKEKEKPSKEIDIDQLLSKPKQKMEEEIFEEDG